MIIEPKKIEVVKLTGPVDEPGRYVVRWARNVTDPALGEQVSAEDLDRLISHNVTVTIAPQSESGLIANA